MATEVDVRDIGTQCKSFYIPSYQRGYRWNEANVISLLDDLRDFCKSCDESKISNSERKYCIQPVTFMRFGDGFRVVDGQQRLTTITLLRFAFDDCAITFPWNLYYEELNENLKAQLLHLSGDASINAHFMREVVKAVGDWQKKVENKAYVDAVRQLFLPTGNRSRKVFFIQYVIDAKEPGDSGQQTFNELNDGQTPLTSSELVKALFMVSDNGLSDSERYEIANEWSQMESWLRRDYAWRVWNTVDFRDSYTRLDMIIAAIVKAPHTESASDRLYVFHNVESWLKKVNSPDVDASRRERLKDLWDEIIKSYWWMRSCVDDVEVYNMLGWIVWRKDDRFNAIYELWRTHSSRSFTHFKKKLFEYVRDKFKKENQTEPSILKNISALRYGDKTLGDRTLVDVLSLVNVLCANDGKKALPFEVINGSHLSNGSKWVWNVEHISPQTPTGMTTEFKEEWLRDVYDELSDEERKVFESMSPVDQWDYVWKQYQRVKDVDVIGNLTLLDSTTNQSYGNKIFPYKRRKIFEVREQFMKEKRPILPCTEKAFAKTFQKGKASQIRFWSDDDVAVFTECMQALVDCFLKRCA